MMKQTKALLRAVRPELARVSREAKKFIDGWQGGTAASAAMWSVADDTYVRASFFDGRLTLEVVVGNFLLGEVKRGARRPGIRAKDVAALNLLVSEGPSLMVGRFQQSVRDLLGCAGRHREVVASVKSMEIPEWGLNESGW